MQAKALLSNPDSASMISIVSRLAEPLVSAGKPEAAGISIPGLADPEAGIWVEAVFSGIHDFPIGPILSEKWHLPIWIENDANNSAYGEKRFGIARDVDDFIWLTVSNGCGSGIFLGGKLFSGAGGNAGEIGHVRVTDEDFLCPCGNKGCLEAVAAGPGIVRRYRKAAGFAGDISAKEIGNLARKGDPVAKEIWKEEGVYLGRAIAAAVNILNVPLVVLGGGVGLAADLYRESLQETVSQQLYRHANANLRIERSAIGYDASLLGAAALALHHLGL